MPDWWNNGFGISNGTFECLNGKWELYENTEPYHYWSLILQTDNKKRMINLYDQKPPYRIFIRIGDPNDGNAMIFEKRK
jgi:hypothetical protein